MDVLFNKTLELTPIIEHKGILFKRDDLFRPFSSEFLNGGKVRQLIWLIYKNIDKIRFQYNNKIAVLCPLNSPKGLIISEIAKYLSIECLIVYENINEFDLKNNKIIRQIRKRNASVISINSQNNDIYCQDSLITQKENSSMTKYFMVDYGIDAENNDVIFECNAEQVKNIPKYLDNLIIPSGSGITASGIFKGLNKYNKKVKNIYVAELYDIDIKPHLDKISPKIKYNFIKDIRSKVERNLKRSIGENIELDETYELKVYEWAINNINVHHQCKTLFWIVWNSNYFKDI